LGRNWCRRQYGRGLAVEDHFSPMELCYCGNSRLCAYCGTVCSDDAGWVVNVCRPGCRTCGVSGVCDASVMQCADRQDRASWRSTPGDQMRFENREDVLRWDIKSMSCYHESVNSYTMEIHDWADGMTARTAVNNTLWSMPQSDPSVMG